MVEQGSPFREIAEGWAKGTVTGIAEAYARIFPKQPDPEPPAGPFVVRNLANSQRFYQGQRLSFVEGDYVTRSSGGKDLVETVCSKFQKPACVGVWGLGGSGKTRLAVEAVATLLPNLPGGVLWLSAAGRERFTLDDVLTDLGGLIGVLGRRNISRAVWKKLEVMGNILLVLDNLDNVRDPDLFRFIEELPGNCSLLFTTKVWLDHEYENYYRVEVPPLDPQESQALVIQQARGRQLTPEQENDIVRECMGNAWFIVVLVAAAVRGTLRQMLENLRQGKDLSPDGRAFEATYNQLTDEARNAFAALSLFQPDASISSLADVARLYEPNGALSELRQWGLVGFVDTKYEQKWWVAPGVASTFAQTLPQRTSFMPAFAHSFFRLAERLAEMTRSENATFAYEQRWEQRRNFLSALAWYGRAVHPQPVNTKVFGRLLRMLRLVGSTLVAQGYWQEVVRCEEQALKAARDLSNSKRIAEITHRLGRTYLSRPLYTEAERYFEESIRWNSDFPLGVARSKHELGIIAQHRGQYEQAESLFGESLASKRNMLNLLPKNHSKYRELRFEVAYSLHGLAFLKLDLEDYQTAEALARESLAIKREPGIANLNEISLTQHLLGQILRWEEKYVDAEKVFRDNLVLTEMIHNRVQAAHTRTELGWLTFHVHSRPDEAVRFYEEALQTARELKIERHEARIQCYLGELLQNQDRFGDAEKAYKQSIEILRDLEDVRDLAMVLDSFVYLLDKSGRLKDAIESQREALDLFRRMNRPEASKAEAKLQNLLVKASSP